MGHRTELTGRRLTLMESPLSSFSETAATAESIVDSDYDSKIGEKDPPAITTESVLILSALESNLTLHQRSKLTGILPEGIQCYLHHWLQNFKHPIEGELFLIKPCSN